MPTGKKIFVSTQNKGKLKEIRSILGTGDFEFISVHTIDGFPDIEETGTSFEENAIIKAEESYKLTGIPSLADDSGLSVDCLDGAPGVYSARYAGENADDEENLRKVLGEIKNFPPPYKARYVCVLAFYDGEKLITTRGECEGELIMEKRGSNGFGYDPIFVPEGFIETMAELNMETKNKLSHRFKALEKMKEALFK
ncbi:MAG: RdgB/HAM1 family non-canonical purine NTP pyrophosphatase [Bacteroidetes bacterium]|nr:RdgB/HAM1 family non-canonical purine NTP pyrophosphatase [Bacteroidota bacterium]